jgi:hypothetical protein
MKQALEIGHRRPLQGEALSQNCGSIRNIKGMVQVLALDKALYSDGGRRPRIVVMSGIILLPSSAGPSLSVRPRIFVP